MSEVIEQQEHPTSLHDGVTPLPSAHKVVKNYLLEFCQLLFDGKNFRLAWDGDQSKTQINIVDKYSFNLDQVTQNPSIVASRGPQAWTNQGGIGRRQNVDLKSGTTTYTDLVRGAVTLSCFAKNGLEAEDIAGFLFESLQSFRYVLRNWTNENKIGRGHHLGLFKVEAVTMGEEALVKSNSRPNLSVVPVAVAAMAQRRWSVAIHNARKLRGVSVRTTT
jgi:hypothetical protein